ncbi:LysM peptidoglycan-binding domain-containing protein [Roseicitreum antarcticum]|uniref:LysM domain-containing protein n=1 Tax=Roseicitreum antarcticum TaxID=564137 RepID=A0A1H2X1P8_9RHOB|nr:LysM domain-containing protein [Roseicitreum antarcticum]SDW86149.1 LysM domain-containing protein [Roseicitreum antarcticum]
MYSEHISNRLLTGMKATAAVVATSVLAVSSAKAQEYVVQPGDSLLQIARSQLGSSARWRDLCELNRDRLDNCDVIYTGMTLRLGTEPAAQPAPETEMPKPEMAEPEMAAEATLQNQLPNNAGAGAMVGALDDGGSLPNQWNLFFSDGSDGSAEVLDVTEDWIDLRITQTGAQGVPILQFVQRGAFLDTTPGQDWTLSTDMALLEDDGSGNWRASLQGSQRRGDESSLGVLTFASDLPLGLEMTRFSGSSTTNAADVALVNPDLRLVSSGPWTATFRIGWPVFAAAQ